MSVPAHKIINNDAVTAVYNQLTAQKLLETDFDNSRTVKSIWFTYFMKTGDKQKYGPAFTIILRFYVKDKNIEWEFDDEESYLKCKEEFKIGILSKIFTKTHNQ